MSYAGRVPRNWGWSTSDNLPFASIPAGLIHRAKADPGRVALRHKQPDSHWREFTWAQYAREAARIGTGLSALGVERGSRVAILGNGRPEWLFVDIGAQGLGATVVGIYPTSSTAEVGYLLAHSRSIVVVVENGDQLAKVLASREAAPTLHSIVVIDPHNVDALDDPMTHTLAEVAAAGEPNFDKWESEVATVVPEDVALIIYTSGTTGKPKGAMWTHANAFHGDQNLGSPFYLNSETEVLSYLPLCHGGERLVSGVMPICRNYCVNFGTSPVTVGQDLQEVQPTFFLGMPRMWEKMIASVDADLENASPARKRLYDISIRVGRRIARHRWRGRNSILDRATYRLGWLVTYRPILRKLGMSRIRHAFSGSAPITSQVLEWLWAVGIPVREVYGLTEASGVLTTTPPWDVRLGMVGIALPGVQLSIAPDGEVLARGPGNFIGYLDAPEFTAQTIDPEGWLHTGDIGAIDADGFLRITGRKKDVIITSGGKKVSPFEIENGLKISPYISEALVIGDKRPHLTALIGIEYETVSAWAKAASLPFKNYVDLASRADVHQLIEDQVDEINTTLARSASIKAFRLLPRELSHEEGEITATKKIRRDAVIAQFAPLVDEMYRSASKRL